MKTTVGLGSDYRETVIEENLYRGLNTEVIRPYAEKQPQRSAGVGPTAPCKSLMVFDDDNRGKSHEDQPDTSSDVTVKAIRKVEEILFFGSDETKYELKKFFEGEWFGGLVGVLETCIGTMTDREMMKIREDFQK